MSIWLPCICSRYCGVGPLRMAPRLVLRTIGSKELQDDDFVRILHTSCKTLSFHSGFFPNDKKVCMIYITILVDICTPYTIASLKGLAITIILKVSIRPFSELSYSRSIRDYVTCQSIWNRIRAHKLQSNRQAFSACSVVTIFCSS